MATIVDVTAPGRLFSFGQFVRTRQEDILATWRAGVLAASGQVDPARADVARYLVGTVTLLTEADRELTTDDVRMTEDLAQRAAVAIENACLFEDAQRAVRAREDVLGVVTHDLRTQLSALITGLRF